MFTNDFDTYVCVGDTIETDEGPFRIVATVEHDWETSIDDDDVHRTDNVFGRSDEDHAETMKAREAWFRDEWLYCGVVLSAWVDDICLEPHAASLWGIEANYPGGDNTYLRTVANELLPDAMDVAHERLATLVGKARPCPTCGR